MIYYVVFLLQLSQVFQPWLCSQDILLESISYDFQRLCCSTWQRKSITKQILRSMRRKEWSQGTDNPATLKILLKREIQRCWNSPSDTAYESQIPEQLWWNIMIPLFGLCMLKEKKKVTDRSLPSPSPPSLGYYIAYSLILHSPSSTLKMKPCFETVIISLGLQHRSILTAQHAICLQYFQDWIKLINRGFENL